ncbi:MAG: SLC13 family permease, partial [Thermodesulfobacteriota bacterium]
FSLALMLGIAYAASIGGMGTLVGTPPNIVLTGQIQQLFPEAPEISFARWMALGLPLVALFLPAV